MCKYAKSQISVIAGGNAITGSAGISEIFKVANHVKIKKKCKYEKCQISLILAPPVIAVPPAITEI